MGAIIGIIYGLYLEISIAFTIILVILLVFLIQIKRKRIVYFILKRRKQILIILISMIIFLIYIQVLNHKYNDTYKKIPQNINTYATVISDADETEYYNKYIIKINNKRFIAYVNKNNISINYGDYIKLEGIYEEPSEQRNYKGFNYKEYLKTKKIYGIIKAENIEIIKEDNVNILLKISNNTKNFIIRTTNKIFSQEVSSFLNGILLGEKDEIPEDVRKNFSKTSLSHILAISGTHISFIIIGIVYVFSIIKTPKRIMYWIIILFLIFFMFLTGFSASVTRASIMACIMILAKLLYRKLDIYNSLAITLLIILIDNPFSINDIGVQLSFLSVFGIVLYNKQIYSFLSCRINKEISKMLSITISAQILILPIVIYNYNILSTVFILSNIIALPLVGVIIIIGYTNILIGIISIKYAKVVGFVTNYLVHLLINIATFMANLPFTSITLVTPSIISIIVYYLLICCFLYKKHFKIIPQLFQRKKVIKIIAFTTIIVISILFLHSQELEIHFIDVGQRR